MQNIMASYKISYHNLHHAMLCQKQIINSIVYILIIGKYGWLWRPPSWTPVSMIPKTNNYLSWMLPNLPITVPYLVRNDTTSWTTWSQWSGSHTLCFLLALTNIKLIVGWTVPRGDRTLVLFCGSSPCCRVSSWDVHPAIVPDFLSRWNTCVFCLIKGVVACNYSKCSVFTSTHPLTPWMWYFPNMFPHSKDRFGWLEGSPSPSPSPCGFQALASRCVSDWRCHARHLALGHWGVAT